MSHVMLLIVLHVQSQGLTFPKHALTMIPSGPDCNLGLANDPHLGLPEDGKHHGYAGLTHLGPHPGEDVIVCSACENCGDTYIYAFFFIKPCFSVHVRWHPRKNQD